MAAPLRILSYIYQIESRAKQAVDSAAENNMRQGMGRDRAYAEAMNDLGQID